jgi:4-carboxymuconolactone decarboxylase
MDGSNHHLMVFVAVSLVLGGTSALAQNSDASPSSGGTMSAHMPPDIDPQSGFRLPLPKREDLDEVARLTYDRAATPGVSLAGLWGPAGVRLYSPKTTQQLEDVNRYLRFRAGLTPRVREVAILTTAREMDSQFEWVAHEPEALKEGVPMASIDSIKHRRSVEGLDATDALVITFGRQLWRDHKVTSDVFAKAKEMFGPHKLVDLILLMGTYSATAAMLTAVDMQLPPGKTPLMPVP